MSSAPSAIPEPSIPGCETAKPSPMPGVEIHWRGASSDATVLEPGTQVTVIQVDGTTLMVEKEL